MQRFSSLHLLEPACTLRVSHFRGREAVSRCYRLAAYVEIAAEREPRRPAGAVRESAASSSISGWARGEGEKELSLASCWLCATTLRACSG